MILILNEELPKELRASIEWEAQERDLTMNDVAGAILATHYRLGWTNSKSTFRESAAARFKLRVPEALHRAIRLDAARDQSTVRGIVLNILAAHYGLEAVNPHRRPRRATA